MVTARVRNLTLAALGGLGWALVPLLDGIWPEYWSVVPAVPPLLGFGLLELRRRYQGLWGRSGRIATVLVAVGLFCLLIAAVLRATLVGLFAVFVVAPSAVAGFVSLGLGSAFLAVALHRLGVLSTPGAAAFALALPVSPLVNAVIGVVLRAHGFTWIGLGVYGLAWIALAYHLYHAEGVEPTGVERGAVPRAQRAVATFVGSVVALLGLAGFLPMGFLSGTPFAGQSALLDGFHVLVGLFGVVAGVTSERTARRYNVLAGIAYVAVSAVPLLLMFDLPLLPDVVPFSLNLPDMVLHLPAGLVSLGVAAADAVGAEGGVPQDQEQSREE